MLTDVLQVLMHVGAFLLGVAIVGGTIYSVVETFILPRSANDPLTRQVFKYVRLSFNALARPSLPYERRDSILAFYAPVALLSLPPVWLFFVLIGYTFMFWAIGFDGWTKSLEVSGSSLLTLGFVPVGSIPEYALSFSEAAIGLILIALLIAYMPTIYSAFQRRELMVNLLEVRAGSPPTAWDMIQRYNRIHGLDNLHDQWRMWEQWFIDLEESHTSIAAVIFFRSQQPDRSWVTAAGAILDAAALTRSTLDIPADAQADLCLRAGYLCLRRICDFFSVPYNPSPKATDPISITRQEFDAVYDDFVKAGVPVKTDRAQAWKDYCGWRVNYDVPLIALATVTTAPYAPWSSDRSLARLRLPGGLVLVAPSGPKKVK